MARQAWYAVVVAGVVLIAALIYTDLPGFPRVRDDATASSTVQLKEQSIRVTVVDTPEAREMGLSGREGLAEDEGMLFVFPKDDRYAFWMKDMRFAIDILWISHDGSIVHVEENVSPESYPAVFTPRQAARYVLELPPGWVQAHEMGVGDIVRL
ncbi:hypothetical protein A2853_00585 [Candidatus Kaiserbacteria bacterium RIFCSPHIGHO2_01_FULL_55_17]|uniref:DUF192 domain-containing protein n=1 Tax=Candidatus Kaiserbacteria bacterium RIFCSPHIGHO2_01_FULL_55_17 TaxID=1798484 RepID=A0A1F6D7J9_9BACT|nr:MAG: hypothetical protein A2853_00585 [Candidatus Kaiserbacteria bacterium RIFCSPHIGHO2_01_FULL_55_17]